MLALVARKQGMSASNIQRLTSELHSFPHNCFIMRFEPFNVPCLGLSDHHTVMLVEAIAGSTCSPPSPPVKKQKIVGIWLPTAFMNCGRIVFPAPGLRSVILDGETALNPYISYISVSGGAFDAPLWACDAS